MSLRVMADVLDSALDNPTAVLVMQALAGSADDDGSNCFPGTRLLARRARVSERTVARTIRELEQFGYLRMITRGNGAGWRSEYILNAEKLHQEAEETRILEREKRCHSVTLFRNRRVTLAREKGDTGARKGDNGGTPLLEGLCHDSEPDSHPLPLAREGRVENEIARAVDQVCNALAITNRRRRPLLQRTIAMEVSKGEVSASVAAAMIAAVREQDAELAGGDLKFTYGIDKFFGLGIWKDKRRWAWDMKEIRQQREARCGS